MVYRSFVPVLAFLTLAGMARVATAQGKPSPPSFVPGEVIVKFSSNSKAIEWMSPKEGTNKPNEALAAYVRSLSDEIDIPCEVKRLGSGGSLVLSVNKSELINRWMERLRSDRTVKDVRALPLKDSSLLVQPVLELDFAKGTPEDKLLLRIAKNGRATGPELQSINEKLRRELGNTLDTALLPNGVLQIKLDLGALTVDLAKRLGKRKDVEYAQLNFVRRQMSAMGRTSPPNL